MGLQGRPKGSFSTPKPNFVMCYGDYSGIFLTNGKEILVDTKDLPLLLPFHWSWNRSYAWGSCRGTRVLMHRLLLNPDPSLTVDHRNGNGLDNRRFNLRPATRQENSRNQKTRVNRQGLKGVYARKNQSSFKAYICIGGRYTHLGNFKTSEEAAMAYNRAAQEHFGEFANLNTLAGVG